MENQLNPPQRPKRPIGVWLLCLMNIFSSSASIFLALFLILHPDAIEQMNIDQVSLVFSNIFNFFIILSVIFTWLGNRYAKIAMLLLLAIYGALIIYDNISLIKALPSDTPMRKAYSNIIRTMISLSLNFWYFNSYRVKNFFKNPNELPANA